MDLITKKFCTSQDGYVVWECAKKLDEISNSTKMHLYFSRIGNSIKMWDGHLVIISSAKDNFENGKFQTLCSRGQWVNFKLTTANNIGCTRLITYFVQTPLLYFTNIGSFTEIAFNVIAVLICTISWCVLLKHFDIYMTNCLYTPLFEHVI